MKPVPSSSSSPCGSPYRSTLIAFASVATLVIASSGCTTPTDGKESVSDEEIRGGRRVLGIAIGGAHACALLTDKSVRCWRPEELDTDGTLLAPEDLDSVESIAAGRYHTCALLTSGGVRCWGDRGQGQLDVPTDLGPAESVAAGDFQSCAVTKERRVRCWGSGDEGLRPNVPSDLARVTKLALGTDQSCALLEDGNLRCWTHGSGDSFVPVPKDLGRVVDVAASGAHACAVREDGKVRCWGPKEIVSRDVPAGLGEAKAIVTSYEETCALLADGTVQCWDPFGDLWTVTKAGKVASLTMGSTAACGVRANKSAHCWGLGLWRFPSDLAISTSED